MSLFGSRSEHGLHCVLLLSRHADQQAMSSGAIAEFLGLSLSFVRKLMTALEQGGLVYSVSGRHGGYLLRKQPDKISVLEVVEILEPNKRVFSCKEIRQRCALFTEGVPTWVGARTCEINAVFQRAEKTLFEELGRTTIEDIGTAVVNKAPADFHTKTIAWFDTRQN
ncbi:MAG: RrF2 family transcriptional regulator [Gammaproteobacteria bacterium]